MQIEIIAVDYNNQKQAAELIMLLDGYALDPMGGGESLPESTKQNLVKQLAMRNDTFSFIAYVDGKAAGLVNAIQGFSTFKAKPLMNIHDITVLSEYRGKGLSRLLMAAVENLAREQDCCKLTLEVLQGNEVAKAAYLNYGFAGYELDPEQGQAMFWDKSLKA